MKMKIETTIDVPFTTEQLERGKKLSRTCDIVVLTIAWIIFITFPITIFETLSADVKETGWQLNLFWEVLSGVGAFFVATIIFAILHFYGFRPRFELSGYEVRIFDSLTKPLSENGYIKLNRLLDLGDKSIKNYVSKVHKSGREIVVLELDLLEKWEAGVNGRKTKKQS